VTNPINPEVKVESTLFRRSLAAYSAALQSAAAIQFFVAFFLLLLLDGGNSARFFFVVMAAHWLSVAAIIARRPCSPTATDLAFVRLGVFLLVPLAIGIRGFLIWFLS
jgi:hypothetical protein